MVLNGTHISVVLIRIVRMASYSPNLEGPSTTIWVGWKKLPSNRSQAGEVELGLENYSTSGFTKLSLTVLLQVTLVGLVGVVVSTWNILSQRQGVNCWYICCIFVVNFLGQPSCCRGCWALCPCVLSQVVWTNHCDYPMGILHNWYKYACTNLQRYHKQNTICQFVHLQVDQL